MSLLAIEQFRDTALVIVDVQPDFMPGGSLPITNGDRVIQPINEVARYFKHIACSLDDHPENHSSFETWPRHCIHGTEGQKLHSGLKLDKVAFTALKGSDPAYDSYSAFYIGGTDTRGLPLSTGLNEFLKGEKINKLLFCGVATDFCVDATVKDAIDLKYECHVYEPGTAAVGNQMKALQKMEDLGAKIIHTWDEAAIKAFQRG